MTGDYIKALEIHAKWLAWSLGDGGSVWEKIGKPDPKSNYQESFSGYVYNLAHAETFFMGKEFCQMVDAARSTVPDDLQFDCSWMQSKQGFMWIEEPFKVPEPLTDEITRAKAKRVGAILDNLKIRAIGWEELPEGGGYYFMCYQSFADYSKSARGFGCWSQFTIRDGNELGSRMETFEKMAYGDAQGYYKLNEREPLHEMRWVYAAMYLMAQRMTHHSKHQTPKHVLKIGEQNKKPVAPFLRVISLRRLQEEKETATRNRDVHWTCRWIVGGHWRKQPYSYGVIKPKFIEAYQKGPENKPLRIASNKIFVAAR